MEALPPKVLTSPSVCHNMAVLMGGGDKIVLKFCLLPVMHVSCSFPVLIHILHIHVNHQSVQRVV